MAYTQEEIDNLFTKYACCYAAKANDYVNSQAIGSTDCGQKLSDLNQFKKFLDILKCYKVETSIYTGWTHSQFGFTFRADEGYTFNLFVGGTQVLVGATPQQIDLYLKSIGWLYDFNENDDDGTFVLKIPSYKLIPYTNLQDTEIEDNTPNDIIYVTEVDSGTLLGQVIDLGSYTTTTYTEEELNCITSEELDTILFWMKQQCSTLKFKPTILESSDDCSSDSSSSNRESGEGSGDYSGVNLGTTGSTVFKELVANIFYFRRLRGQNGVNVTSDANYIYITSNVEGENVSDI